MTALLPMGTGRVDGPALPRTDLLLHELVADQAAATPDSVAVIDGDDELSYVDLDRRAEALARVLVTEGVGADDLVAVKLPRGFDLVVSLLAVWKAGGAFLPLDPDHPADRIDWILSDAKPKVVIDSEWLSAVPEVDDVRARASREHRQLRRNRSDQDLAYVIYTSGSTGRPKGVAVPHEGIRNRVLWAVLEIGLTATDRMLQKTTVSFDAAVWEFFGPLVAGGVVVLAPAGAQRDAGDLVRAAARHRVTVLQFVPTMLAQVVAEPELAECDALRLVFCAGEPLPPSTVDKLLSKVDVRLYNTYGPTECSIDVTAKLCEPGEPGTVVSIGEPLTNIHAIILDADGEPSESGELHIGGAGLARGYLNQPGLTADRFVPDPYSEVPGARLYRTGDLVSRRADGLFEFLGRLDHQVKIRGVRIEPGEVETALRAHPQVAESVVTAWTGPSGVPALVGYVRSTAPLTPGELREFAADRLPSGLVPSYYVVLPEFPVTASGKVDRNRLPAPLATQREIVTPVGLTQTRIAQIWAQVLDRDVAELSADEDFFTIGGDSLSAARILARLRQQTSADLPGTVMFQAPTIRELASVVDGSTSLTDSALSPVDRDVPLALSSAQERLWLLDRLNPGSNEYLLPVALQVHGELDLDALQLALDGLVTRHEVLRTRIVETATGPVQCIDAPAGLPLYTVDTAAELRAYAERGFDLAAEHPVRAVLATVDNVLLLVLHHIAGDGWSMDPLAKDLAELYRAARQQRAPRLPELTVQYADYAAWQRALPADERAREYWHRVLADVSPSALPTDRPRPAERDLVGERVRLSVPPATVAGLLELGRGATATPFQTLCTVFATVLGRFAGQYDLALGLPVAGRDRVELEELLGFFVNTLVLRAELDPAADFAAALATVRQRAVESYEHQDYPFDRLVAELAPERDLSRNPLFQVMFQLHDDRRAPFTLDGVEVEPITVAPPAAIVDLALAVEIRPDGSLHGELEYATALFDADTVRRIADAFVALCGQLVAQPDRAIGDLDLRDAELRARLREQQWDTGEPATRCLHELIGDQARRTPDALAVASATGDLTYAELETQANGLARHLVEHGVQPGNTVGVALDRGHHLVIALLAVLKAGAVYLPLSVDDPAERLQGLIRDTHVYTVISRQRHVDKLPGVSIVDIDRQDWHADSAPEVRSGLSELAYVIYTSGSTGKPKGVMVEHRSYVEHCQVMAQAYRMRPGSRVALMAAATFDAAMDQIAAPLLAGAAVVIVDLRASLPAQMLVELTERKVQVIDVTPVYYRELMDHLKPGQLTELELMSVGGDVVTYADARRWADTGLPARFGATYGPTEATIACTFHVVNEQAPPETAVPLGKRLTHTPLYVLDQRGNPVPTGVIGELYVGGSRVARGYYGRPDLTAERFLPDPFSSVAGARMYRTGDRVRQRPDGVIEFHGRVDRQVKIRGFRIEPGEVESVLAEHPRVHAAAVIAHEIRPGDHVLVGYAVLSGQADPAELREFLAARMPAHMVPSHLMLLDELPVTGNGKVDRRALPAPDLSAAGLRPAYQAPRDEVEQRITEIWHELLGAERIGRQDNFFDLGGHSLLATRACLMLAGSFGIELGLRQLFAAPTVAALAEVVRDAVEQAVAGLSDAEIEALLAEQGEDR
ncbi:amino acid adenylation domain-containing protein [Pseudonocardiaceae bacterium YIM PH 21723]|nr:amino acid adenylation domain-containing protein [Pseudonocardiaceae bacterium YIM PH 21723]